MIDYIVNFIFRIGFKVLMLLHPPRNPKVFKGSNSSLELYKYIREKGHKNILIITTKDMINLNLLEPTYQCLDDLEIRHITFDKVLPNPTLSSVNDAISVYHHFKCDAVIAFGGGSVIDASKAVSLQIGNHVPVKKLIGLFKARKAAVPFYVVPTTAGTGSEVTSAAVISDDETHQKLFIVDHKTIPIATALDPNPMLGLPPFITADTGMDALTHAIEAYISKVNTKAANEIAVNSVKLIFENLFEAYNNGDNSNARENMAVASYEAGVAFNRMGLGFVHAISHQLTAHYGIPHGRANAMVLPKVLEVSFTHIIPELASLAKRSGVVTENLSEEKTAKIFLNEVIKLSESVKIPQVLSELKESDFQKIIRNARDEAIKNYPVTYLMSVKDCELVLKKLVSGQ